YPALWHKARLEAFGVVWRLGGGCPGCLPLVAAARSGGRGPLEGRAWRITGKGPGLTSLGCGAGRFGPAGGDFAELWTGLYDIAADHDGSARPAGGGLAHGFAFSLFAASLHRYGRRRGRHPSGDGWLPVRRAGWHVPGRRARPVAAR